MNKETIEELEIGDRLLVEFGLSFEKGKYIGKGLAKISIIFNPFVLDLKERKWVFLRKSIWSRLFKTSAK